MKTTLEAVLGRVSFDRSEATMTWFTRAVISGGVGAAAMSAVTWLALRQVIPVYALGGAAAAMLFTCTALPLAMQLAYFGAATGVAVVDLPLPFGGSTAYTLALGIALAVGQERWSSRLLTVFSTWLGGLWALLVMQSLSARHLGELRALSTLVPLAFGLFLGLGAWVGRLRIAADDVEPLLEGSPRALVAWDRLRAALRRVPAGAARVELLRVMRDGVGKLVEAQRAHAALSTAIDRELEQDTVDAIDALTTRRDEVEDQELKAHLEQTLRVHRDVLEQLSGLQRKAERAAARVSAELGWLETAAFSVELAPRNADGLQSLAGRLASLRPNAG